MGWFEVVGEDAIRNGECTDVYFKRVVEVMERDGVNPQVTMEVTAASLPDPRAVFCGLDDVIKLLEGLPVDVDAMPEARSSARTSRYGSPGATGTSRSTRPQSWVFCHASGWRRLPPT